MFGQTSRPPSPHFVYLLLTSSLLLSEWLDSIRDAPSTLSALRELLRPRPAVSRPTSTTTRSLALYRGHDPADRPKTSMRRSDLRPTSPPATSPSPFASRSAPPRPRPRLPAPTPPSSPSRGARLGDNRTRPPRALLAAIDAANGDLAPSATVEACQQLHGPRLRCKAPHPPASSPRIVTRGSTSTASPSRTPLTATTRRAPPSSPSGPPRNALLSQGGAPPTTRSAPSPPLA